MLMDLQEGLYDYTGVLNLITDLAPVVVPIAMLWKIQISPAKKFLILSLFGVRIVFVQIHWSSSRLLIMLSVPAITVVQLVYFHQYFDALFDQTWSSINPWILTQVVMKLSIITACIPSLRRVVTAL